MGQLLKDKELILRALEPSDLEWLYQIENDTSLWTVSDTYKPYSKDLLARYLENAHQDIYTAKQLRLVIEWSAQAIGLIDLFDFNPKHKRASVGIVVAAAYRSKGFAKRALNLMVAYAKDTLDCHQIVATITEDNSESIRLFESAGFKRTGVREDWVFEKGVYIGEYFYQRIL
jgi:diamine N-acetyltransferase